MLGKVIPVALALVLTACSNASLTTTSSNLSTGNFTLSPYFQAYYTDRGGLKILGEPISPEISEAGIVVQYFRNAKLEYHPQLPQGNQVIMASLGERLYGRAPCVPPASAEINTLYFNECHSVSPEFREFFEQYGGVAFFGYPISERYIYNNWLAQNFERAIIIWDADQTVAYQFGLLPLGALDCPATVCTAGVRSAIVAPPLSTSTTPPTPADRLERFYGAHGGLRVFGLPLAGPRLGEDGARELVYENAILYENPAALEGVSLRPLGLKTLGAVEPPALPLNGPNTSYFSGYGHNISYAINEFYKRHGGEAVFGQPISEWRIDDNHFVQYFENVALTLRFNLPVDQSVQLVDLGRQSLGTSTPPEARPAPPQVLVVVTEPLHDILLDPAHDQQTLKARILDENGLPVPGAKVQFIVHTPQGDMALASATDAEGYAAYSFTLSAFVPGSFVLYDVNATYDQLSATASKSFVTWGNPGS